MKKGGLGSSPPFPSGLSDQNFHDAPAVANSATSELAKPMRRAFMRTSFRN
jgi:hypothetical protein